MSHPSITRLARLALALIVLGSVLAAPVQAGDDSYTQMLHYLAQTRIQGHALSGASGVVGVNQAAGDFNQQANVRAIAVGGHASVQVHPVQLQLRNRATPPDVATATIGGHAFHGAHGILSINQASGTGNTQINAVAAALAKKGIREAGQAWFAATSASAGGNNPSIAPAGAGRQRTAAVEATSMQGVHGVVQLNQVAGSANTTGNQLQLSVSGTP